jgi:mRNA-degrading endonuclease toxin of MazEF toxin-antitoxin module
VAIEQGGIFRHDFGPRKNHLQEGPRPVVVVQTDALNALDGYGNVIVVPLTTREKKSPTYARVEPSPSNGLDRTSWAIGNQIFTIDKAELKESIGEVTNQELFGIKEALKIALNLS